jgi:hypothetical protein
VFEYLDFKMAHVSFDGDDFREGKEFDIEMPADLDQFRRDNSHGAVVGRKSLVQLGHDAADGRAALHQIDIITGVGQIQCRLHPGNTAADNTNRAYDITLGHFFLCLDLTGMGLRDDERRQMIFSNLFPLHLIATDVGDKEP